ncbi:MAG: TonB-dependent receptor [Burkholderiales bacterium]|nr:TonB-dependent receptor [Burkholderiales bacterium]
MKRIALFFPFISTAFADEPSIFSGNEILVTATRFDQTRSDQPVGVSVITEEAIRNSPASSLPELLSGLAGIKTRNVDGSSDPQIDLRGFGMSGTQNTLVLLDGQRLNEIELTSISWSAIPLASISRIEVVRGAGAVLYGGGATGGVINIITKTPRAGNGSVAFNGGSYGKKALSGHFDASGARAGMSLSVNSLDSDNYRVNNRERQKSFEGDIHYALGTGTAMLKFGADSMSLRLPGTRSYLQLVSDPRGTSTPNDYGTRDGGHFSIGARQSMGSAEFDGELSWRSVKRTAFFANFGGSYLDTRSGVIAATPRFRIPYGDHTLLLGLDLDTWDYNSSRSSAPAAAPLAHVLATQNDEAAYFLDTMKIDADTSLTLGGRIQRVKTHADDTLNTASYAHGNQARTPRAYEFGIRRLVERDWTLYARVGNSFRTATVDEIYNQYGGPVFDSMIAMLEPQTSHDREIGADFEKGDLHLHGSLYHMDLNNEIHYNALTFTNMNLSPTRRYGLELEGRWGVRTDLELFGSYTYAVSKFRSGVYGGVNVAGNAIPLVPRQAASFGMSSVLPGTMRLEAVVDYVGRQYFDNDQSNTFGRKIPDYATANLKLSRKSGPWTLNASVGNLFDKHYYSYGVASTFTPGVYNAYPMPGRNFTVGAEYRFE